MKRFGKCKILEEVKADKISVLYKAEQVSLGRVVSLRLLQPEFSTDPGCVERFKREAKLFAKLNHPAFCQIYDIGEEYGSHYVAVEYSEGITIRETISNEGRFSLEKATDILSQIAVSLDYANSEGVLLSPLLPEDIIVTKDGKVKLLVPSMLRVAYDFAEAGLSGDAEQYVAPELSAGGKIDKKSDIYCFGVMSYEILTGKLPFKISEENFSNRDKYGEPVHFSERGVKEALGLEPVIFKCIEKDPLKRYASATQAMRDWKKEFDPERLKDSGQTRVFRGNHTLISKGDAAKRSRPVRKMVFILSPIVFLLVIAFLIGTRGGSLSIRSNPSGVSVYIDGLYVGVSPVTTKRLQRGEHTIIGKKDGFKNFQRKITFRRGGGSLNINMVRTPSQARIITEPEGARVFVGGELKGNAPLLLKDLYPGEYRIKLAKDGYATEERVLKIGDNKPVTLNVKLSGLHASLTIDSDPAGAVIYLDGEERGTTPKTINLLKPGYHELSLTKKDYNDYKKKIFLRENQQISVKPELKRKLVAIVVKSVPEGAKVLLDGEDRGKTPLDLQELLPGEHKLRFEKEGYETVEKAVVLSAEEKTMFVEINMNDITGSLLVVCSTPGSLVYVDGEEKGTCNQSLSLSRLIRGEHQLQLVKAGYKVAEKTFVVEVGKTSIVNLNLEAVVTRWRPTVRIHLKGGGQLEGEIVKRGDKKIVLRVEKGLISVSDEEVESEESLVE